MFVNSLEIKSDSSFLLFAKEVIIDSYEVFTNKIVVKGKVGLDQDFLDFRKTIARISVTNFDPSVSSVLEPSFFTYKDLEEVVDSISVSQRVITKPSFTFEIPYSEFNLNNIKIYMSFISSLTENNQTGIYEKSISLVASSELIKETIISDKTYLAAFFEDSFLIKPTEPAAEEINLYASELFQGIDSNNNYRASIFYNIREVFKSKIYFKNLINYPEFLNYFKQNYFVDAKAILYKDNFSTELSLEPRENLFLNSGKENTYLNFYYQNIDTLKYNNGIIKVDVKYNESSIKYIENVTLPFLQSVKPTLGKNSSSIFNVLAFYKLIKEQNSSQDSLGDLLSFIETNEEILLNSQGIEKINSALSYVKDNFGKMLEEVTAQNIANTIFSFTIEQQVQTYNNNAYVEFFDLGNQSTTFPVFSKTSFLDLYTNETSRFFSDGDTFISDEGYDINELPISFSSLNIKLNKENIYQNNINFNQYLTSQISASTLDKASYDFSKICSYFTLNRDPAKIKSYDYNTLLEKNLFYNSLSVFSFENVNLDIPRQKFSVTKKDDASSYITFPFAIKNDACTDSITTQPSNNSNYSPEIVVKEKIPENLFNNITVNSTFSNSNKYASNYLTKPSDYTTKTAENLPVQVLYPYSQFVQKSNSLFQETEPVISNSKLFSIFYSNFKLIGVVEYLSDITDGIYTQWRTLTISNLDLLPAQTRMLCRINFYKNSEYKIEEQSFDAFSIYNRYFFLEA